MVYCNHKKKWSPLRQEPEAPYNNETSCKLYRIPPPVGAGGFQVAGLSKKDVLITQEMELRPLQIDQHGNILLTDEF